MSRTIVYQYIDGQKVVIGFGQRTIDPVMTNPLVMNAIKEVPELAAIEEKRQHIKTHMQNSNLALSRSSQARAIKDMAGAKRHHQDFLTEYGLMEYAMDELRGLLPGLENVRKHLVAEHAVYFELPDNEEDISSDEYEILSASLSGLTEKEILLRDGSIISDYRGTEYYQKVKDIWTVKIISRIGEVIPADGKRYQDLTEQELAEINKQRISMLTPEQKADERQAMEEKALNDSIIMRQGLEIQKDPDALAKSQTFYEQQMADIAVLYG